MKSNISYLCFYVLCPSKETFADLHVAYSFRAEAKICDYKSSDIVTIPQ